MQLVPQPSSVPVGSAPDEGECSHTSSTTAEARETSEQILDIIFDYALNKFQDTKERLAVGRSKFLEVIDHFVAAEKQVDMCLPAFPFKSANKVAKVFGVLPDKAEELALGRLNVMCVRIEEVYPPGARLTIISDGLVYNGWSDIIEDKSLTLSRLLRMIFCIGRLTRHSGSRYVGLRRGSTHNGCTERIRTHCILQT